MPRILYVLPSLEVGGAERSLLELVRRLDRDRFSPHLCSLARGGPLKASFEAAGVPVHELDVGPGLSELHGARLLPLALRVRPAIVHARLWLAGFWARLVGPLCGAKVICEERNLDLDRPRLANWLTRATRGLATVQLANASAIAALMHTRDRIAPAAVRLVPAGIDPRPFLEPRPEGPDLEVVSVHRLVRYKGTADLLEAFARVRARRPGARLLLVGDGPERAALERRAAQADLAGGVLFTGRREDLPAQLGRARVFALLSHDEGTPNALLEAMAAALPVVATPVAGSAEAVADGVTGRLVPLRDPAAAADALLGYLADPALAAAHGARGRARVLERYSIDAVARTYHALYEELLRPRSAART